MGGVCTTCIKDYKLSGDIKEFDIECVKKNFKSRKALPCVIKIQAA